jgi:hypothetical protein
MAQHNVIPGIISRYVFKNTKTLCRNLWIDLFDAEGRCRYFSCMTIYEQPFEKSGAGPTMRAQSRHEVENRRKLALTMEIDYLLQL